MIDLVDLCCTLPNAYAVVLPLDVANVLRAADAKVRRHLLREAETPLTSIVTGIVDRQRHLSLAPRGDLPALLSAGKKP